jgi:hypothetical protein
VGIKFLVFTVPLLILSSLLTVLSFHILAFPPGVLANSLVLMLGTTLFLSGLAIGFGASLPRFRYEHHLEISLGPGGLLYMLTALTVSLQFVCVLAYPIFRAMGQNAWHWQNWNFSQLVMPRSTVQGAWLLLCILGTLLALTMGVVSLSRREEFDR